MIHVFPVGIKLIVSFVSFFLFLFSYFVKIVDNTWSAVISGTLLALIYVGSGFLTIYLARTRFEQNFIRVFLYSLAARFVLILVVIILIIKFTSLDKASFIIAFFIWYFIFQIWEVLILNRIVKKKA